tara:strand:+ start:458 stop:775 length:318 start_codon:yes stop_codon:yes gene_type:complete
MTWQDILKAYKDGQVKEAYLELDKYIRISCGIVDDDFGEPDVLDSYAGRLKVLKEIMLDGDSGDFNKQFSKIEDYADDWPSTMQSQLGKLSNKLYTMLKWREDNS